MTKTSRTILFFGSGPVAAKSLDLLLQAFEIEAVITKPQPPHHKEAFPVLAVAAKYHLPVLATGDKAELSALFSERPVQSQLGVVIDYGILIGQDVIDYFPLGIVNSHFSLLPRWRGADPISYAILNGDKETGVSLMLIDEKLDEGPLLAQQTLKIDNDATTPSLTDQLIAVSHQLLIKTLPLYVDGQLKSYPQPTDIPITYSRKLTKADGVLDWNKSAAQLEREVRAYTGWPRSLAKLGSHAVIVTQAHVGRHQGAPGQIWQEDKQLGVYTTEGILVIDRLIPAGKQEMTAQAFLAGYKLSS